MECHTEIAAQVQQRQGTHGKLDTSAQCANCHKEHLGSDYDPVKSALASFDHNQTSFPLAGKHGQLTCDQCHKNNDFNAVKTDCVSCHAEPSQHAGLFGTDCGTCHTSTAWKPATMGGQAFSHENTTFSLVLHVTDKQGQPITCTGCHTTSMRTSPAPAFNIPICITCHQQMDASFMQKHITQYGQSCFTCHDGRDRLHNFDHNNFFPLNGKHTGLDCGSCHVNQQFRGISTACVSCHQEPAVHAGFFGLKCQFCHTTTAWQPAKLSEHSFPLQHGGNKADACQTCHTGPYTQYTCYACHDHQPDEIAQSHSKAGIPSDKLPDCSSCHLDGAVHKAQTP